MEWDSKIRRAISRAQNNELFALMVDWSPQPASDVFLEELRRRYSFCPSELVELLRIADGFYINHFVIAGSPTSKFRSISELTSRIEYFVDCKESIPFAHESSGRGIYCVHNDGKISLTYCDNGDKWQVADSFREFLSEMLMGEKYWRLFRSKEESEWSKFLVSEGWLQPS